MTTYKENDWYNIFVELTMHGGSLSVLEHHELKDGYEIVLTTKRVGGKVYAKARKRKIDAENGC